MVLFVTFAVVTALLSSVLTCGVLYWGYKHVILPDLDRRMKELERIADSVEEKVARGVRTGMKQGVREIPSHTLKETTQSFSKVGADLIEGGISALFRSQDKERK